MRMEMFITTNHRSAKEKTGLEKRYISEGNPTELSRRKTGKWLDSLELVFSKKGGGGTCEIPRQSIAEKSSGLFEIRCDDERSFKYSSFIKGGM